MTALSLLDFAPREREALALLLSGKTQTEIAQTMAIPRATVTRYLGNARRKLGLTTTSELATWALRFDPPVRRPQSRTAYYLARFAPLKPSPKRHRWGCLCSVCFIHDKDARRPRR